MDQALSQQRRSGGYQPPPEMPMDLGISDHAKIICCGVTVLVACVAFLVTSLGAVPPLHLGIKYSTFTKAADMNQIFGPGLYMTGPFNNFILFPSDVRNIEFSNIDRIETAGLRYAPLHTRTKEGLGLHLQVSLQYRLIPQNISSLYSEFNQNYEQVFVSSVRDVLIKAASEYEATQLWEERDIFSQKMQQMVDHELRKTYAECWGLQLMVIDLPDGFEQSIVQTQVQKQMLFIREQQQVSTKIRAETSVIKAEYDRKVKVLMADGHANYTVVTKEAQANAERRKIQMESEALAIVKKSLHLSPEGLVRYQQYGALDDLNQASLMYGFGPDQALLKPS